MPFTDDTPINRNTPYRTDIGIYCENKHTNNHLMQFSDTTYNMVDNKIMHMSRKLKMLFKSVQRVINYFTHDQCAK